LQGLASPFSILSPFETSYGEGRRFHASAVTIPYA
jgi:hypothetical protein